MYPEEVLVLFFALLVALAIPVAVIVLLVSTSRLKRRTARLEAQVEQLINAAAAARRGEAWQAPAVQTAPPPAAPLPVEPEAEAEPAPIAVPTGPWQPSAPQPGAEPLVVGGGPEQPMPAATGPAPDDQNRLIVLRADRFGALLRWLRSNWVYAVSAVSLALAGVFLVQYGIEKGYLPPPARVALAVLLGLALIAAGETVRRRWGDETDVATAYLPSIFSGAGLVSIFAGITAGRLLYGLYGPAATFAGLLATAAASVWLGWRHGPLLVAVGLLGAGATPFLVAAPGDAAAWTYGFYALIAAAGLAVDAIRRWAWVSVLALAIGYGGAMAMQESGAGVEGFALALFALAVLAIALPQRSLAPDHEGPGLAEWIVRNRKVWPPFPVRLAAGALVASILLGLPDRGGGEVAAYLPFLLMTALALALLLWAHRAPGLADLAALPALGFLLRLGVESQETLGYLYRAAAISLRPPETAPPLTVSLLLGLAVLISGAFALRSFLPGAFARAQALAAVLVAPVAALILELLWDPSPTLGLYPWALHVIVLAAAMVGLALRYARLDGEDRRRVAWATLSALSLIALALFLITTKAALTLALAVLVVVAARLDRRFHLPEMGWFIQLGVAVLGWRLIVDPGVDWALDADLPSVVMAFGGAVGGLVAARVLLPEARTLPRGVVESGALGFAAIWANVMITRWLTEGEGPNWETSHWGITLNTLPWLVLMLVQLYRLGLGGPLVWFRRGLALLAAIASAGGLAAAILPANPLFAWNLEDAAARVLGPMILDSLALAYAVPGAMLLAAPRWIALRKELRLALIAAGSPLLALYVALEIRRFWQGDRLGAPGVEQGELYSYTVAMLVLGAGLLWQALARRSASLRRVAMIVIAVTVAKVFLIDASGLTGLTRVFSFLGLGLSLAGLAWLNRWAGGRLSAK